MGHRGLLLLTAFEIRPMRREDAETVAAWHYEPPYDFYDFAAEPEDLREILDPARWVDEYHAVYSGDELVGFFSFRRQGDDVEVGLGLRPDLTGRSLGAAFLEAGLEHARLELAPAGFFLDVATFNERARKVYERAGFRPSHVWTHDTFRGPVDFLRMTRPA